MWQRSVHVIRILMHFACWESWYFLTNRVMRIRSFVSLYPVNRRTILEGYNNNQILLFRIFTTEINHLFYVSLFLFVSLKVSLKCYFPTTGRISKFGDTSCSTASPNLDHLELIGRIMSRSLLSTTLHVSTSQKGEVHSMLNDTL